MPATLDHLVLRMRDEPAMLAFYTEVLGFAAERLDEYRSGEVPFPSVRIDATTIIDLFPTTDREPETRNLDHFCIALDKATWETLRQRLRDANVALDGPREVWGALGSGTSLYLEDPDGNTVELKKYDR